MLQFYPVLQTKALHFYTKWLQVCPLTVYLSGWNVHIRLYFPSYLAPEFWESLLLRCIIVTPTLFISFILLEYSFSFSLSILNPFNISKPDQTAVLVFVHMAFPASLYGHSNNLCFIPEFSTGVLVSLLCSQISGSISAVGKVGRHEGSSIRTWLWVLFI